MPLHLQIGVGLPIVSVCIRLASEILDASERVVANHTRCELLVGRIRNLMPLLNAVKQHVDRWVDGGCARLASQLMRGGSLLVQQYFCVLIYGPLY